MFGNPDRLLQQESRKATSVGATLNRFTGYFKPYWWVLAIVTVLMVVNTYTQVISPELIGQAVDCYLTPAVVNEAAQAAPALPGAAEAISNADAGSLVNCWFDDVPAGADSEFMLGGLLRLVLLVTGLYILGSVTGGMMFFGMTWAGQHVLRPHEPHHQRHRHHPAGAHLCAGTGGERGAADCLDCVQHAGAKLGLRPAQPEHCAGDGLCHRLVQRPGPARLP